MNASAEPKGLSLADAAAHVAATDPRFALGSVVVRGQTYRCFANAPATLRDLFVASAAAHGEGAHPYLHYRDEVWTYDAFLRDAAACAAGLAARGVRAGDRVGIAMRNYPDFLIAFAGIVSMGGVAVFLNSWWTAPELAYAVADSGLTLVIADGPRADHLTGVDVIGTREAGSAFADMIARHAGAPMPDVTIDPDDDFAVMYSSGTTGDPKGVVLTHRGAVSAIWTWLMSFSYAPLMQPADAPPPPTPLPPAMLITTPLFHVTATHPMFLLSVPMGARVVLMHKWDPEEAVRLIERHRITRMVGVPTQTAELLDAARAAGATLDSLAFLGSGGAKRPAAQVAPLARAFPRAAVASGWGMTETNAAGMTVAGDDYTTRPETAGRFLPPLQDAAIWDDTGAVLPTGQIGELVVRSPCNMRCYLNKPEATAETLQNGWLRTGDLARMDDDGYVFIHDRKKNIIIRGGENIACLDVEGALHEHPAVQEAGCFPVPDDRLGEVVGAGIHLRDGATVTAVELQEFLRGRIAPFKVPEHIWLQHTPLPRGATDKTDRRALARQCLGDKT